MSIKILMALLMTAGSATLYAQHPLRLSAVRSGVEPSDHYENVLAGDVNGDGFVNMIDVACTIGSLTGSVPGVFDSRAADVNRNGTVDDGDVAAIANIILYGGCPDTNHPHMIDLGLPSGTCWACCNVGAAAPEAAGRFYAWGLCYENSPYLYNWDMYRYGDYDNDEDFSHIVDIGSDIAGTANDAASVNWGAPWRMPTLDECQELIDHTNSSVVVHNGVSGRLFVGRNGRTVFLPAAGDVWYHDHYFEGSDGLYWTSVVVGDYPCAAHFLSFTSSSVYIDYYYRYAGFPVRPVTSR